MKLMSTISALLIMSGTLVAADVRGKVVSVDAAKSTITLSVEGKDRTLPVEKGASVQAPGKKKSLQGCGGRANRPQGGR